MDGQLHRVKPHFSLTVADKITEICKPLKESLGIDFFLFQHNTIDRSQNLITSTSALCTNADVLEFIWSFPSGEREDAKYNFDKNVYYQLFEATQPIFCNLLKEKFHLNNMLCKDEKVSDTIWEHFIFATTASQYSPNLYLNNMDLLNKFIIYFKNTTQKLLKSAIGNMRDSRRPFSLSQELILNDQAFLQAIEPKRYLMLDSQDREVSVPWSEVRCLLLLTRGRSAKDAAKLLGLSPRTIESSLYKSRVRLNCISKGQLLNVVEKNIDRMML